MKILNLFAGIGGNRYHWDNFDHPEITAIEHDPVIAEEYSKLFPHDVVKVTDAYDYIEFHVENYDIIWASPPCQTHSHLGLCAKKKRMPDMRLYGLILFLQKFHKGKWVVENVKPYYQMPILGKKIGRHIFWSNVDLHNNIKIPKMNPKNWFNVKVPPSKQLEELEEYLGFKISRRVYVRGNHDPAQIYRNCVHPLIGFTIMDQLVNGPGPELLDYLKVATNDA